MFDQMKPAWATETLNAFAARLTEQIEAADTDASRTRVRKDVGTFFAALEVEALDELDRRLSVAQSIHE